MRISAFYSEIFVSEEACCKFLQDRGLLPSGEPEMCGKVDKEGVMCTGKLEEKLRKKTKAKGIEYVPTLRCIKKGCQRWASH